MKTKIAVVDDHTSIREMLAAALTRDGSYDVVGSAGTGFDALRMCRKARPNLAIVDLQLPEMNGVELLRHLRAEASATRVIFYSGSRNPQLIMAALLAEPHGFVQKQDPLVMLHDALRAVASGCSYFTAFANDLLRKSRTHNGGTGQIEMLTARERAVLQLLAEGCSSKAIAAHLSIATKTAEHHRAAIMTKLGVRHVAGLTRIALGAGLISVD